MVKGIIIIPDDEQVKQSEQPEPLVASPHPVTSASVGTALVTGPGTITGITMNQPTATSTDMLTQLSLIDAAAAPGVGVTAHVLYAVNLIALACENEPRPGLALTPGLTAPTWPKAISSISIPFTNGLFVQSCPINTTFTVTA
jgi:hypothetical protein